MLHLLVSFIWIPPVALASLGLLGAAPSGHGPGTVLGLARATTILALATAVLALPATLALGPQSTPLFGWNGLGLAVRLDLLSATLFLLIAFVGAVVVQFSRNYLDGDPGQRRFTGWLCVTLAAAMLLVLAGNILLMALAWIATSLTLHRLLVFYPERPKAVRAARKKFIVARLGDICLLGALALIYTRFGTGDIARILQDAPAQASGGIDLAAILIALAAMLKSAQFPAHGWLTEVMETPTPVSALLHAGIINAGGFLVIRFADLMVDAPAALLILVFVGGFTALLGAVVMMTKTSIKVALAWSTVAQMGFMLFECGLGLFPLAVLHLVAHSLYKAHAFLSSGSAVDAARYSHPDKGQTDAVAVLAAFGLSLAIYSGIGALVGSEFGTSPQALVAGAVFVMALFIWTASVMSRPADFAQIRRVVGTAGVITLAYLALHAGVGALFGEALPPPPPVGPLAFVGMVLGVVSFGTVAILQVLLPGRAGTAAWRAARVHIANGLYANAIFDRFVFIGRQPLPGKGSMK